MRKLHAAATAIVLGTAALAGAALQPALAAVSSAVGRPLLEAKSLAAAKNYRAAMDRVNAAAAAAKTAEERQVVEQMKNSLAIASGDTSTVGGAKAKIAADSSAGRWKDVIADGDALRKLGALDGTYNLLIAQAYYQLHDATGCMNYVKRNGLGGESALMLLQRCAYDAKDEATQRSALEQLVASTGKSEHWTTLLRLSERARGLKDHQTLDIFRIKSMTNTLAAEDVVLYATFAIQFKSPAEAKAVVDKSVASNLIPANDRTNRLLKLANDRINEQNAAMGKLTADAQKAPKGDDLVALGETQIGQGKAKDAIATIQAGIAKGLNDPAEGQLRLGTAYLAAGQKADAIKTFNAVKGDEKVVMVARLYSIAARSGASASPADAAPAKGKGRKK